MVCCIYVIEHVESHNVYIGSSVNFDNRRRRQIGFSNETRAKMSAAHKGKTLSDEVKAKISAKQKGIPRPRQGAM